MKSLLLDIYSNDKYRKGALGGISEKADEVLLVAIKDADGTIKEIPEGVTFYEPSYKKRPAVMLVKRNLFDGDRYMHLEPYEPESKKHYMMGGSYAHSSDSRVRRLFKYPLPIHDRNER